MSEPLLRVSARFRREYPEDAPLGQAEEVLALPPTRSALLLIDVYPREGPQAHIIRTRIVPATAAARGAGLPIIYATNYLADITDQSSEWRKLWLRTLGKDVLQTWAEPSDVLTYLPEIAPSEGDHVVRKQHYSGFLETNLHELLQELGVHYLFLAGFDARICVAATATDALAHDYGVIVLRDAIATTEIDEARGRRPAYEQAVRYIESCTGYTTESAEFIAACGRVV